MFMFYLLFIHFKHLFLFLHMNLFDLLLKCLYVIYISAPVYIHSLMI